MLGEADPEADADRQLGLGPEPGDVLGQVGGEGRPLAGDPGHRDVVDEPGRRPGDPDRAVAGGGRRDELDQPQVVLGRLAAEPLRLLDGQVGDDQAVDPGGDRLAEVAVHPPAQDDRVRDHRHERGRGRRTSRRLGAEAPEHLEDLVELDPTPERPVVAGRDHRAVGDRVGVRDAHLDHVRPPRDHLGDQRRRGGQVGVARRDEGHQGASAFALEAGEQGVDAVHAGIQGRRSRPEARLFGELRRGDEGRRGRPGGSTDAGQIGSPRRRATS